eukprot:756970-Prymnesium_polylepis.1
MQPARSRASSRLHPVELAPIRRREEAVGERLAVALPAQQVVEPHDSSLLSTHPPEAVVRHALCVSMALCRIVTTHQCVLKHPERLVLRCRARKGRGAVAAQPAAHRRREVEKGLEVGGACRREGHVDLAVDQRRSLGHLSDLV